MVKQISSFLLLLFALFLGNSFSQAARSVLVLQPTEPQVLKSFKIKPVQADARARSCSYSVSIRTSCSSSSYTRDRVSLAFGDSYGNEVYAPRLDDPSSRTFERCSSDTFQIQGPCTYDICYIYLLRVGSDGWMPESVKVTGPDRRTLTFNYNTFLPNGVWFGFNHCNASSKSNSGVAM
ncbi:OLC1v1037078C1 [Oldenlandia corymbosa var. corymbosa]|uniref:OLC1v1037078C1 n=1 Tax=Oldenlandia corymbosa var. corymbosa TaxID=529605 RepID=A0AAV1CZZ4_OLDCO|nr:OLC1v1037078C1 [Oldenlandia corymbosa var. corymbosa]